MIRSTWFACLYQYRPSMWVISWLWLYHHRGYNIEQPLRLYHTCGYTMLISDEVISWMWLYYGCGYIVVISWLYHGFLSSFEHCLTLIFDRDLRSIVAILTVSVSFSLYSFVELSSFFRFFFVDDFSFLSSSVPLSESSLPELGRGVALMISSFTMLMSASRSSLLLSMHGSLPILFNRSAATLSMVRRMSGYRSRTASKCSTDSENRLQ